MASSKVMASTSPANQDPSHHQFFTHSANLGSINMDDLLHNVYEESQPEPVSFEPGGGGKAVDEVWKEAVAGGGGGNGRGRTEMTLEDFLTKAGAVREDDVVKLSPVPDYAAVFYPVIGSGSGASFRALPLPPPRQMQFGSAVGGTSGGGGGGGGRGRRKLVVEEVAVDKATQQKQRRMIKNRESASRSRERKQAYTVELEALVTQLEEKNARLLKEEAEMNKDRFKQLMENLVPVVEKRRPPRVLRRTSSV